MNARRALLVRIGVVVFVVASLAFFAYAIVDAWSATNGELPSLPRLVASGALWAIGLVATAYAWAELLGGPKLDHGAAQIVSQLGKYVPGGVVQATGQVGLARSAGVSLKRGATAFTVVAICGTVAGGTWCVVLAATWTNADLWLRVLVGAGGLASLMLVDRRWMVWTLRKIPRTRDTAHDLVPNQRAIVLAYLAGLVSLGAVSTAYLVLLGSFGPIGSPLFVISAYAAAWTVGFVAVPIPSGVGIREAVLAGILHGVFPASVLVAASVYLRLVLVVTEGLLALIASHRVRPSRLAAARAGARGAPTTETDQG